MCAAIRRNRNNSKSGLTQKSAWTFSAQLKKRDYHKNFNGVNFTNWFNNMVHQV